MTIKATGLIGMSDINVELAFNINTPKSLNDSDVRTLLAKPSGVISLSDAYGKTKPIQAGHGTMVAANGTVSDAWAGTYPAIGWESMGYNFTGANAFGSVTPLPLYSPTQGIKLVALYWDTLNNMYCLVAEGAAPSTITVELNGLILYTTGGYVITAYSVPAGVNFTITRYFISAANILVAGNSYTIDF